MAVPTCACRELGRFEPSGRRWQSRPVTTDHAAHVSSPPPFAVPHEGADVLKRRQESSGAGESESYYLYPSQRDSWSIEEELYISNKKLTWSSGSRPVKNFSFEAPVLQAAWCSFEGRHMDDELVDHHTSMADQTSEDVYLCVLMRNELAVFSQDGDEYTVSLPFHARRMWETSASMLLIEAENDGPRLFSLTHPLAEPKPVGVLQDGELNIIGLSNCKVERVFDCQQVFSSEDLFLPVLMTLDGSSQRRVLWTASRLPDKQWNPGKTHLTAPCSGGISYDEGDAVAMVYSHQFGWTACGSIGLGAEIRKDWKPSHCQVVMKQVWEAPGMSAGSNTSIIYSQSDDRMFLGLLQPDSRMMVYSVGFRDETANEFNLSGSGAAINIKSNDSKFAPKKMIDSVMEVTSMDAIWVISVSDSTSVEKAALALVLTSRNELVLYQGLSPLCKLQLKTPTAKFTKLSNSVCGRVNVETEDGQCFRFQVPYVSCLLSRSVLVQIKNNLSESFFLYTRRSMLALEWGVAGGEGYRDGPGGEWSYLAGVMQAVVEQLRISKHFDACDEFGSIFPTNSMQTSSSWELLLQSEFHVQQENSGTLPLLLAGSCPGAGKPSTSTYCVSEVLETRWKESKLEVSQQAFAAELRKLLLVLHLLYEDVKLNVLMHSQLVKLGRLQLFLSCCLGVKNYCDYYIRHHPEFHRLADEETLARLQMAKTDGLAEKIPDICRWVCDQLDGYFPSPEEFVDPSSRVLPMTAKVCKLFACMMGDVEQPAADGQRGLSQYDHVRTQSRDRISPLPHLLTSAELMRQASGISLREPKHTRQVSHPESTRSSRAPQTPHGLIRLGELDACRRMAVCESVVEKMMEVGMTKEDINCLPLAFALPLRECLWACRASPPKGWGTEAYKLVSRADLANPVAPRAIKVTGVETYDVFKGDLIGEMKRAKQSQQAGAGGAGGAGGGEEFTVTDTSNVDGTRMDGEFARLRFGKDRRLAEIRRCLSSVNPVRIKISSSEVTDHDAHSTNQNKLQLLARRTLALSVGRGMFTLGTATPLPTEALPIPPLQLSGRLQANDALIKLDVSLLPADHAAWPEFHNGVAAALRLSLGQTAISRTWIVYNKPDVANFSHAGVLMGLGLQGHLKALAKPDLYNYLCQDHEATQIGIMLGMAASKRGTMDESVFRMLYVHIPSLHPANYPDLEVASPVQTAAIMGLGLLYMGSKHRRICEVLLAEIGRRATNDKLQDREGYALAAGMALGLVTLGQGNSAAGLADLQLENMLRKYISGGRAADASQVVSSGSDPSLCCRIKEGENVNLDVTSPGATLALGLMFLQTNSRTVAERLEIPSTSFMLQEVRPDLILLRILARNLVLWDRIAPTSSFVESQIPDIVKGAYAELDSREGGGEEGGGAKEQGGQHTWVNDLETLRHVHANIVAGCCLSLGLRYAGSAEERAADLLMDYLKRFQRLRAKCEGYRKIDKQLIETCIGLTAISAALVMAGTGDLELLRILRTLRGRVDADLHYGHHMAISMALGLLFLGGGRATLCTSKEAIAALVIALYPRFPISTSDCRYHLQAFRHLYVLAVENRCLETVDVKTNMMCMVPVQIDLHKDSSYEETSLTCVTPCILPEMSRIKQIRVLTSRYFSVTWDLTRDVRLSRFLRKGCVLRVQRKIGHLSYGEDPHGLRSLHARPFSTHKIKASEGISGRDAGDTDFIQSFSGDPAVLAFAQYMCKTEVNEHATTEVFSSSRHSQILYECLTREKPEALDMYTELLSISRNVANGLTWSQVQNLRIILTYYGLMSIHSPRPRPSAYALEAADALISESFLIQLRAQLEQHFVARNIDTGETCWLKRYIRSSHWPEDLPSARLLANLLILYSIPDPSRLEVARASIKNATNLQLQDEAIIPTAALFLWDIPADTVVRVAKHLI